jgi:hypothetical protein
LKVWGIYPSQWETFSASSVAQINKLHSTMLLQSITTADGLGKLESNSVFAHNKKALPQHSHKSSGG